MNIKKAIPVFVSLVMAGGVLAGCAHKHTYEEKWTAAEDGSGHYHIATCHPDEHDEKKDHVYDDDKDTTCNDCNYERKVEQGNPNPTPTPTPTPTPEEHTHTYNLHKVTCDICDYHNPVATTLKGWDGTDNGFTDDGVSKIYVVGDSTVCDYEASIGQGKLDERFLPRYGYGTQLHEYLNYTSDKIVNLAMSGRSAVSLMGEPAYQTLVNSIGEGDYLIIGFGHNDEKLETNRFGDPAGNTTDPVTDRGDSWKYILNENYLKLAKHRGATPILCTPITRYNANGTYTGNTIHDTQYGNYPEALKELGEETETTVVDLTTLTKNLWIAAGEDAKYFHAHSSYTGEIKAAGSYDGTEEIDGIDGTHINKFGAKAVAYELANALKTTSLSSIVKTDIVKPTKEAEYVDAIKQDFVRKGYVPFNPDNNADRLLNDGWYKAAMGNVGTETVTENHFKMTYSDGTYSIKAAKGNGKIESGQDGIGAIFTQLSTNDDFTISVHAKITAFDTSASYKQAAFGIMLRDDVYMDAYLPTLNSDYVKAGVLTNDGYTNNDPG
ncbi:MAG: hypothetical protein K2I17_05840, partial [Clostridia bacterium]|nr:hypothetical protein [Clostridia bacterium]